MSVSGYFYKKFKICINVIKVVIFDHSYWLQHFFFYFQDINPELNHLIWRGLIMNLINLNATNNP